MFVGLSWWIVENSIGFEGVEEEDDEVEAEEEDRPV